VVVACDLKLTLFANSALLTEICMRLYSRFQFKKTGFSSLIFLHSFIFFLYKTNVYTISLFFCCSKVALKN